MVPPLGVQLTTPVTLVMYCLGHSHVVVELMGTGHHQNRFVKVCLKFGIIYYAITIAAVDCGPLTNPDNGQVDTPYGTTFRSTATYTCDTGYALSGSQSRSCGADGNWTSSEPFCEGVL